MQNVHSIVGGDWYNISKWSNRARDTGILVKVMVNGVTTGEIVGANDREYEWIERLTDCLVEDIFHYKILKRLFWNHISKSELEKEVNRALDKFGAMNILYFEDGIETDREIALEQLTIVYGDRYMNLFLTTEKDIGMPVRDFMLWLRGSDEPKPLVISEWSGVPHDNLDIVYRRLVDLFAKFLEDEPAKAQ